MSGLTTYYQMDVSASPCFYKSIDIFTSRYDRDRNYIGLYPKNIDVEVNQEFANSSLDDLNTRIITYTDRSMPIDWNNPRPLPQLVRRIEIKGDQVRAGVDRLFQNHQLNAQDRSEIEDTLRELDRCLYFNSRLSGDVTSAQKGIIESFITPYVDVLKEKMEPWHLKGALYKSAIVVNGYVHPKEAFGPIMRNSFINRHPLQMTSQENPNIDVINKQWDSQVQEEVLESLYMVAWVITGKATLESALEQSGTSIPNLQTQKAVVMEFLGLDQLQSFYEF